MIVRVRQTETSSILRVAAAASPSGVVHSIDSPSFEPSSPLAWLQAAREIPQLARILFDSVLPNPSRPSDFNQWTSRFQSRPNWRMISNSLRNNCASHHDPDSIQLAEMARSISVATGWADADAAFWRGLLHAEHEPIPNLYLAVETSANERNPFLCVTIADLLLQFVGRRSNNRNSETSRLRSEMEFLRLRFPTVDWQALVHECHELPNISTSNHLSPIEREIFLAWADSNVCRIELILHESALKLASAKDESSLLLYAGLLVGELLSFPCDIWIELNADGRGIGQRFFDRTHTPSSSSYLTRADLETNRDPHLIYRHQLLTPAGESNGFVLASEPISDSQRLKWLSFVSESIESYRRRQSLDSEQNKLKSIISESADREMNFRQQAFLQMIAEFSAGAGHEINNPLGTIAGKVQILLRNENDPGRRQALHKISEQVDRIHRMIRDLHFIGSHVRSEKTPISLSEALSDGYAAAIAKFDAQQISLEQADEEWEMLGHRAELARLFSELIINAAEAAGEIGRVTIRTKANASNPDLVEVQISDTGTGFTEKDRQHAFEPFYSGRSAGRGLGMGLCVVRRIADDHGLAIILGAARPTTVTVLIPFLKTKSKHKSIG